MRVYLLRSLLPVIFGTFFCTNLSSKGFLCVMRMDEASPISIFEKSTCQSVELTKTNPTQTAESKHPVLATASIWLAVAAMVCILGFWFSGILLPEFLYMAFNLASLSLIFSFFSKKEFGKNPGRWSGRRARIGKFLGFAAIGAGIISLLLMLISARLFGG